MNIFEMLREQLSVEQLVGHGPGARSNKVACVAPAHDDANPSMHLYDDHVHCFSCGYHGDVVDVWAALRGFDRPIEAALDLAREYGVDLPEMDPVTLRKVQERRATEERYLRQARACHRALDQDQPVAGWWEGRGFGKEPRARFLLGADPSGTAAVIPFWNRGRIHGLVWRKLEGKPKYTYPRTEDFPEGHRPLFIPGSLRNEVFLVEGIIDALALAVLGESTVAVGGTNISKPQLRELERLRGALYILPDADEAGKDAAREWARRLYPKALSCPAEYGGVVDDA